MNRRKIIQYLIIAFLVETFCVTYGLLIHSIVPYIAIVYILSGLIITLLLLVLPQAKQSFSFQENAHHLSTLSFRIMAVLIMCIELFHFYSKWIEDAPLDYHHADMLPIMKIMCNRFLNSKFNEVYHIIPEIWNGIQPVYLPALWMPFCTAVAANIDLRWVTAICLMIVFTIFIFVFHPSHQKKNSPYILLAAFILFWWLSVQQAHGIIPYTEEGIVIFYYVIVTLALLNGNIWFIAIGVALCLLSRYALIGWLLPFTYLLLYDKKYISIIKLLGIGLSIFIVLMIIPFGWAPFQKLLLLPNQYIAFAQRVWNDSPIVFASSLGLARFFGPNHIRLQHQLLIILSFLVPFVFVIIAVRLKDKKKYIINNIALASFKLSLIIFYNLIDVPYLYLFYTSSFASLLIVGYFVSLYEKDILIVE
jgi:hypothetical protein